MPFQDCQRRDHIRPHKPLWTMECDCYSHSLQCSDEHMDIPHVANLDATKLVNHPLSSSKV